VAYEIKGWRGINDNRPLATQVALLNYGQTPAHRAKICGTIRIMPFPLPPGYKLPELKEEFPQSFDVFPSQSSNPPVGWITAEKAFTADEIAEITSETSIRHVYMLGRITYLDVFDKPRETIFRSFLDPKSIERNSAGQITTFVWAVAEGGNDFL